MFDIVLKTSQTWLICGGRDFTDTDMFKSAMGDLIRLRGMPWRVVQGGANGADLMARIWADQHALESATIAADWQTHGRAAGPIRNQAMLDSYSPDLVVAFPGGKGTADMVRRGHKAANTDVAEIKLNQNSNAG